MTEPTEHTRLTKQGIEDWFREVDAPEAAKHARPGYEVHHQPPMINLIEEFLAEKGKNLETLKGNATRHSLEPLRNDFIAFLVRKKVKYIPMTPEEHLKATVGQAKIRAKEKRHSHDKKK